MIYIADFVNLRTESPSLKILAGHAMSEGDFMLVQEKVKIPSLLSAEKSHFLAIAGILGKDGYYSRGFPCYTNVNPFKNQHIVADVYETDLNAFKRILHRQSILVKKALNLSSTEDVEGLLVMYALNKDSLKRLNPEMEFPRDVYVYYYNVQHHARMVTTDFAETNRHLWNLQNEGSQIQTKLLL